MSLSLPVNWDKCDPENKGEKEEGGQRLHQKNSEFTCEETLLISCRWSCPLSVLTYGIWNHTVWLARDSVAAGTVSSLFNTYTSCLLRWIENSNVQHSVNIAAFAYVPELQRSYFLVTYATVLRLSQRRGKGRGPNMGKQCIDNTPVEKNVIFHKDF